MKKRSENIKASIGRQFPNGNWEAKPDDTMPHGVRVVNPKTLKPMYKIQKQFSSYYVPDMTEVILHVCG